MKSARNKNTERPIIDYLLDKLEEEAKQFVVINCFHAVCPNCGENVDIIPSPGVVREYANQTAVPVKPFPETIAEVEAYETRDKKFGNPDINFPVEEQWSHLQARLEREKDQPPVSGGDVEELVAAAKYGYDYHKTTQFPELSFEENCKNNFLQSLQLGQSKQGSGSVANTRPKADKLFVIVNGVSAQLHGIYTDKDDCQSDCDTMNTLGTYCVTTLQEHLDSLLTWFDKGLSQSDI